MRRSDSRPKAVDQPLLFELDPAIEEDARRRWGGPVAGVDEAGRGPLAGPVVAAAVILDPARIPDGLDDSKALTAEFREELFAAITAHHRVAFAAAAVDRIDRDNIRGATLWAMRRAVAGLCRPPQGVLVDGKDVPPNLPCRGLAIVKGDARVPAIAAASIVAKVVRDRLMRRQAGLYPGYGFERHVGYATPEHQSALERLGPCPLHRRSFAPVREALERLRAA